MKTPVKDPNVLLYSLPAGSKVMVVAEPNPTQFEDVVAFHERFRLPNHNVRPLGLLENDVMEFRLKFLREELQEMADSHDKGDLLGFLDGLLDLVYVAYGTASMAGVSDRLWLGLWQLVQNANMLKVRAESQDDSYVKTGRGHNFDVVKPNGWVAPTEKQRELIQRVLLDQVSGT